MTLADQGSVFLHTGPQKFLEEMGETMSSSKQELIDKVVHLLETEFDGRASQVTAGDRAFLERSTVSYLESKLQQLQNEVEERKLVNAHKSLANAKEATRRQYELFGIFKHSGLTNAQVNERLLDELLPGPTLSFETFRSLIEQNPNIAARFMWSGTPFGGVKAAEAEQNQQQAQDRRNFAIAAQAVTAQGLGDVGDFDSNFKVVREKLGTGFSAEDVIRVLTDGSITGLAPSTNAAELREQHRQKLVENHNQALLNATPQQLKAVIRQEAVEQHQTAVQAQFERELLAGYERDVVYGGKPPLPTELQGKPLGAHFIKTCSPDIQRRLAARYGSSQLTARAHGITKIGKYNLANAHSAIGE